MRPTSGKKRTRSDERAAPVPIEPSDRKRANSGVRQARLIYPYCPVSQSTTFLMKPVPLPPPRVTPHSIAFCLPPGRNDLNFMFQVATVPGQSVYIRALASVPNLSFQINQMPFANVLLPCNVSRAIANGNNLISFCPQIGPCSTMVELIVDITDDVNRMAQFVLDGLPKAEAVAMDPFASTICPISGANRIEVPCRGRLCKHAQCFDLKSFLRHAIDTGMWNCPVCGEGLQLGDLRHDVHYLEEGEQRQGEEKVFDELLSQLNPDDDLFGGPRDF